MMSLAGGPLTSRLACQKVESYVEVDCTLVDNSSTHSKISSPQHSDSLESKHRDTGRAKWILAVHVSAVTAAE
jgi:hypothetical protein